MVLTEKRLKACFFLLTRSLSMDVIRRACRPFSFLNDQIFPVTLATLYHETLNTFQPILILSPAVILQHQFSFPYNTSNGLRISKRWYPFIRFTALNFLMRSRFTICLKFQLTNTSTRSIVNSFSANEVPICIGIWMLTSLRVVDKHSVISCCRHIFLLQVSILKFQDSRRDTFSTSTPFPLCYSYVLCPF